MSCFTLEILRSREKLSLWKTLPPPIVMLPQGSRLPIIGAQHREHLFWGCSNFRKPVDPFRPSVGCQDLDPIKSSLALYAKAARSSHRYRVEVHMASPTTG
eukprot:4549077-Amphidinium_carterae.1